MELTTCTVNQLLTLATLYLDDNSMCWQIDAPSQRSGAHNDTYQALGKVTFDKVAVLTQHASMMYGKAVGKQLTKLLVSTVRHLLTANIQQHQTAGTDFCTYCKYQCHLCCTVSACCGVSFRQAGKVVAFPFHCQQWLFNIHVSMSTDPSFHRFCYATKLLHPFNNLFSMTTCVSQHQKCNVNHSGF